MLMYKGISEDLKKYGYKSCYQNEFRKCIRGYLDYIEIKFDEVYKSTATIKRVVACGYNYCDSWSLTDKECIPYIQDLIEDELVIQCEKYIPPQHIPPQFINAHKVKKQNIVYKRRERKNRGVI